MKYFLLSFSLPSADSFKKACYQLQAKVCAQITGNCWFKLAQEKVWFTRLGEPKIRFPLDHSC